MGKITMAVKLVRKTAEEARAMIEAMAPRDRAQVSQKWLARIYSSSAIDPWTLGYTLVRVEDGAEVGQGGFKSAPSEGIVEIAYGVAPNYEGRGYATEAARALVRIAIESGDVQVVVAHTFEQASASARVLSKVGFECIGQVVDPDDGLVWKWERRREKV